MLAAIEQWKQLAIDGWLAETRPWFSIGEELGAMQADLVGALPSEVVLTGSTTGNLHTLASTFYRPAGGRTKIVADALNFPSDLYAMAGQVRMRGLDPADHLVLVPSGDGYTIDEADLIAAMGDDVAMLVAPSVLYRSGQLLDIERLARAAHERGVTIGLDCSHSVGAVPHRLHDWGVDWAVWCTYKYLNGGPGSVATIFVHERHHGTLPATPGWWGSDKERQFDLANEFTPAPGAGAWQIGTPSILGSAPLFGALAITREAGIERIRAKSLGLRPGSWNWWTPGSATRHTTSRLRRRRDPARRGGHMALAHLLAVPICKALKARGIVPDFRPPNLIRVAPEPRWRPPSRTSGGWWRRSARSSRPVKHERYGAVREAVA